MSTFQKISGVVGLIAGVIAIYVFANDELRARFFPELTPATRADVEEQMRLSEERIISVVQSSLDTVVASAEARGTEISEDNRTNYEAALTSLLASEDPTLNDAKFLALTGQAGAAADSLVAIAESAAVQVDPIPEKSRADMLRSAGDIFVPSEPEKALAAYRKAQQLDPENQILATRIQQLTTATAQQNAVVEIPNATFEFDGVIFEFEGCETDDALLCVFSVTNTTPDTKKVFLRSFWAIDESSRWMEAQKKTVRENDYYVWDVPSLGTSQIDFGFSRPANILQYIVMDVHVDGVSYIKRFRDIAVRGGRDVDARQMRSIDPAFPERAFTISDVRFHFLGCSNPDAPICRVDLINEGRDTVRVSTDTGLAFDNESRSQESVRPDLDIERSNASNIPPGIVTGWTINFRRPADYLQVFELRFQIDGRWTSRRFTNLQLADGAQPEIKSFNPDSPLAENGFIETDSLRMAFKGCTGQDAPKCIVDVQNKTDDYVRVRVNGASGSIDGQQARASTNEVEMTGRLDANVPPGLTTSLVYEFSDPAESFASLDLSYGVEGNRNSLSLVDVSVQ